MPNFLYDMVDLGELTRYIRLFDNEVIQNQLVLNRFLPDTTTEDIEFFLAQGGYQDVDAGEYRAWDTAPRFGKRQGFTRMRGELPPLARAIPLGEEERMRLRQVQGSDEDARINQIYQDAQAMARAVQIRVELARAQALYTGTVVIKENGLSLTATFGVPAGNFVTAGTVWSNPAAPIFTDLLSYQQTLVDLNGQGAGFMLMSTQAYNYMLTNTEMKSVAAFAGSTPPRLTPDILNGIIAEFGLPAPVLYDAKFRVNGTQARAIPADRVILLPPSGTALGETMYGVTAQATDLVQRNLITRQEAPGLIVMLLENASPMQTVTEAHAIALPLIGNPKALFVIDAF